MPHARDHLQEILSNTAFRKTGICPDHILLLQKSCEHHGRERIAEILIDQDKIIALDTEGLQNEWIDGKLYGVLYTDGSLFDPLSEHFIRAGWGLYVAPNHKLNMYGSIPTSTPTIFRAELRAILQAFLYSGMDVIVKSDCKAAVNLVNKIIKGQPWDKRHDDADILQKILDIVENIAGDRIVQWIPAHLDEDQNHKKREAFFRKGGEQKDIDGNCGADSLAKS